MKDGELHTDLAAAITGEYQRPGWDKPCLRLTPNGNPGCEHSASDHREDGVCEQCEKGAAFARPCARPMPKEWRRLDPILQLRDREVRVVLREQSTMVCGRLVEADEAMVTLEPIGKPMRYARNGGRIKRDQIQDIALILDSWR